AAIHPVSRSACGPDVTFTLTIGPRAVASVSSTWISRPGLIRPSVAFEALSAYKETSPRNDVSAACRADRLACWTTSSARGKLCMTGIPEIAGPILTAALALDVASADEVCAASDELYSEPSNIAVTKRPGRQ